MYRRTSGPERTPPVACGRRKTQSLALPICSTTRVLSIGWPGIYHESLIERDAVRALKRIQYAIIHRYPEYAIDPTTGKMVLGTTLTEQSRSTVRQIAACLRLIRPTRVLAQFCEGSIAEDGSLYNIGFADPILDESLPISHRQFAIHTVHAEALRDIGLMYMQAMTGKFWKFRMAAQMHEAGYFQHEEWKVRFFLWTAALEALFTTQNPNRQHSGSVVAKGRIKDLLGAKTLIYPPDEYLSILTPPRLTVEAVVDELYCLRNHIAHGDKLPRTTTNTQAARSLGNALFAPKCSLRHSVSLCAGVFLQS